MVNKCYETIFLNRITAITLLVRLENGDIPYPHSKKCREQLAYFLSYILTDDERNHNILQIDITEVSKFVDDVDSAFRIMKSYGIQ